MENEETNLNTELNDIAGNRIGGPIGNTAARPGGPGTGIPGGAPAPAAGSPPTPDVDTPAAPASSESLVDSEMDAGQGAVEREDAMPQENKEADPADLAPTDRYGGNFSNSTQNSYRDQERRDNQDSDPNRGEFGAQDLGGTTHGGFGNQNRQADYVWQNSPEDRYYGGPGRADHQDNAYRAYDGQDERPDARTEYGFERGATPAPGPAAEAGHPQSGKFAAPHADNRNQPDRADAHSARQNDNGAANGPDSGFAADYGRTSLRGEAPGAQVSATGSAPVPDRRNQTEDYLPTQAGADHQGRRDEQPIGSAAGAPAAADPRGGVPAGGEGYGDRGREAPRRAPDFATGDDRNGYVQGRDGDAAQGLGSRGGSYNDAYDDSRPGSTAGSPAAGDQRREDRNQNYGEAARQENRTGDDNSQDHGAPQRNAGRDGEADE